MNRRDRRRRAERRAHHNTTARLDLPVLTITGDSFTEVKRAHIVPRTFQAAWAQEGKVTVHVLDEAGRQTALVPMPITHAGTRNRYYRRERPDGSSIDDTEASLAFVEAKAAPVLRHAITTVNALSTDEKGGLAQFVGVQMVRGPRFFNQRADLLAGLIAEVPQDQFKPAAIRAAQGDLFRARARLEDVYTSATQAHLTMLTTAAKLGVVIGNMRWELLTFAEPVLAYSDHPVVVWPGLAEQAVPSASQGLGPLGAAELLIPLGPRTLLLANWVDLPDPAPCEAGDEIAAHANAFVVAQADRQWMHSPGASCPVAEGPFVPLTTRRDPSYNASRVQASVRRAFAAGEISRSAGRRHLKGLRVLGL